MSEATNDAQPQAEATPETSVEQEAAAPQEQQTQTDPGTQEELSDAVEQAVEEGASEEEVRDMIREFDLKVNGKTFKKKIDLSDEDAIKRELQKAHAGQQAMQEVSELKKLYNQEISRLQEDPWSVLKELEMGDDQLDEIAAQRLQARLEEEQKSPEQREKEQLEQELQKYRQELEAQKKQAEEARAQQLAAEAESELSEQIEKAFDAHPNLPQTERTVARIADAMDWAIENGFKDVQVEDVIPTVQQQYKQEINALFDTVGDDGIEEYLGKKRLDSLRKKRLQEMKKKQEALPKREKETAKSSKSNKKSRKKKRMSDFFREL